MSRLIKDYVELDNHLSLDAMISRLTELRESLPDEANPELVMRGDDVFGRHLAISFSRPLTAEEAAVEGRYGSCPVKLRRAA